MSLSPRRLPAKLARRRLSPVIKDAVVAYSKARMQQDRLLHFSALAAALRALADHKLQPWDGEGPMDHWMPELRTRQELHNIADELDSI
jgi:hypothetical protein